MPASRAVRATRQTPYSQPNSLRTGGRHAPLVPLIPQCPNLTDTPVGRAEEKCMLSEALFEQVTKVTGKCPVVQEMTCDLEGHKINNPTISQGLAK